MTHLAELLDLQDKARRAGRVCSFFRETESAPIDAVAYLDAKGPGRQRAGLILSPLAFAEIERPKLAYWQATDPSR